MSTNDQNLTDDVKNAFDIVTKIYKESSFLLKEFASTLDEHEFVSVSKTPMENYGGYTRSLGYTEGWLVNCAELRFKSPEETHNDRLISVTVSFRSFSSYKELSESYLIVGILENMEDSIGWLYAAYHNEGNGYEYAHPKSEWQKEELVDFTVSKDRKRKGCFLATPLLQVQSVEDVKRLTGKIVARWKE